MVVVVVVLWRREGEGRRGVLQRARREREREREEQGGVEEKNKGRFNG